MVGPERQLYECPTRSEADDCPLNMKKHEEEEGVLNAAISRQCVLCIVVISYLKKCYATGSILCSG